MHTQGSKRNGAIDFWKFIFAVVIVTFHTFLFYGDFDPSPFIGGNIAVEFFFLVSGFLMAQSASKLDANEICLGTETKNFLFRKIKGLFPELAVAWIIGFIVENMALNKITLGELVQNFLTGIWELFFLRMSGLTGFRANTVTWYISAMLIAMLVLFPLLVRFKKFFIYVIAPCIVIFLLGYMCKEFDTLARPTAWAGIAYRGTIRAFAELALGCILWALCQKIKQFSYTKFARIMFSLVELLGYAFCLLWVWDHKSSRMGYVLIMILAISITITFSHVGILARFFDNRVSYALGKLSFLLYIGHIYWVHTLGTFFPDYPFKQLMLIYVCLLTATVLTIALVSYGIRKGLPAGIHLFKKLMLAPSQDNMLDK